MKKISLLLLACGLHICCFSQNSGDSGLVKITRAAFLSPAISYEVPTARFQSLHLQGFLAIQASFGYSSAIGSLNEFVADPAASAQYRFYYNLSRRKEKGKPTAMNNLNYFAPVYQVSYSRLAVSRNHPNEADRRFIHVAGAVWGLQRNYHNRFSLDLSLGLGYAAAKESRSNNLGQPAFATRFFPTSLGQLSLGFWLNRRNPSVNLKRR